MDAGLGSGCESRSKEVGRVQCQPIRSAGNGEGEISKVSRSSSMLISVFCSVFVMFSMVDVVFEAAHRPRL